MSPVRRGLKPLGKKSNVEFDIKGNVLGEEHCQDHRVKSREVQDANSEERVHIVLNCEITICFSVTEIE